MGPDFGVHNIEENLEESPNLEAQKFYDLLSASEQPLFKGCENHSELSAAVRMLSIKSESNGTQYAFNQWANFVNEIIKVMS